VRTLQQLLRILNKFPQASGISTASRKHAFNGQSSVAAPSFCWSPCTPAQTFKHECVCEDVLVSHCSSSTGRTRQHTHPGIISMRILRLHMSAACYASLRANSSCRSQFDHVRVFALRVHREYTPRVEGWVIPRAPYTQEQPSSAHGGATALRGGCISGCGCARERAGVWLMVALPAHLCMWLMWLAVALSAHGSL